MSSQFSIPGEQFLHWIWENLHYDASALSSGRGQKITVLDPGEHNASDGPDFKRAHIQLDGLDLYGSVEIHINEADWYNHGHHLQPSYNQVLLHVVLKRSNCRPCKREDGTLVPVLELKPCLPRQVDHLLSAFRRKKNLPCQALIQHISEEAIKRQFDLAHKEYFDRKVREFGQRYSPDLPPLEACRHALVISIFDGLGISKNREPMRKLARRLLALYRTGKQHIDFYNTARKITDFAKNGSLNWKRKGCRPANRPELRLRQACLIAEKIMKTSFDQLFEEDPEIIWDRWLDIEDPPGSQRSSIIYGTVFLPAVYYLGWIGHSEKLKKTAYNKWKTLRVAYPESLVAWFNKSKIPPSVYRKKLGAVHQMKRYCRQGRCNKCLLLKNAISS